MLGFFSGSVFTMVLLVAVGLAVLAAGLVLRLRPSSTPAVAPPIAHTPDGAPVYQVVGYTADGRPITADQAVGYQQFNPKTNSVAVVAFIMRFVFAPLAVPFGHIARGQIRRTGEQGGAFALTGLVLGYLGIAGLIVGVLIVVANL
jgi:hypothetical protein